MTANQFGKIFRFVSFGESHGPALGAIVEGCPAGLTLDLAEVQTWLHRRRPGQDALTSSRNEQDTVEILSGVFENKTLGTPICMIVRNKDARSADYNEVKQSPRPGHADDMWKNKFGHVDHRGGGRSSGRETLARVLAGAVAHQLVRFLAPEVKVTGWVQSVFDLGVNAQEEATLLNSREAYPADQFRLRFPSEKNSQALIKLLESAKSEGLSYGGVAKVVVQNPPQGLGQPVFRKIKSDLAQAALSLGASMSFELGLGKNVSLQEGSEFHHAMKDPHYGGVRGGMSTGEPIHFQVAFKPTSSVLDVAKKGRHDPCIVPRAIPVLEAMTWVILADQLLWKRLDRV
ncbi:MAG: chorismate synthase [Bdellovibrionales bacterium]|nr:chorismate synthase [Bdellovibrionales bacterium]